MSLPEPPGEPSPRGHVLLAPDRFRGALPAVEVSRRLAAGLRLARPDVPVVELPVSGGGDGTAEAAVAAGFRRIEVKVCGPAGRPVPASLAFDGRCAVVEVGEAAGPRRLPDGPPRPLSATTVGVGQLIAHALRLGARRIVLSAGASAAPDGGAGLFQGLGGRLLDGLGRELPLGGAALRSLHALDLRGLPDLSGVTITLVGDTGRPLLGRAGAVASVLSGGTAHELGRTQARILEAGLLRWADLAESVSRRRARELPGAGAAGGAGFAALTLLGATVEAGPGTVLDLIDFAGRARGARLVVTGAEAIDTGTLRGGVAASVARAAARAGVPAVAVAGRRGLTGERLRRARIQAVYALADIDPALSRAPNTAGPLLERLTVAIADEWLPPVGARF
ncbi:glycerate kinase [Actinomadura rupiterrae]|uniref:glycerate kinase n=1 Tax=Actinomadura rupiterrae TaxID=559627 RepID=UPI0020A4B77D|nr:glycerate kinase [Actinomadura rupiterrae]MCP2338604.1 glycerate kinase [Actinomadura rupiterrae]